MYLVLGLIHISLATTKYFFSVSKFAKIEIIFAKSRYIVKMFAKKIVQKMIKNFFAKLVQSVSLNVKTAEPNGIANIIS